MNAYERESVVYCEALALVGPEALSRAIHLLQNGSPDRYLTGTVASFGTEGLRAVGVLLDGSADDVAAAVAVAERIGAARADLVLFLRENRWRSLAVRDVPLAGRATNTLLVRPSLAVGDEMAEFALALAGAASRLACRARIDAITALGWFPGEAALAVLSNALGGAKETALAAVRALGRHPTAGRVCALSGATRSASAAVRREAESVLAAFRGLATELPTMRRAWEWLLPEHRVLAEIMVRVAEELDRAGVAQADGPAAASPSAVAPSGREDRSARQAEFRERAKRFRERRPEVSAPFAGPPSVFVAEPAALARALPEDRPYREDEMRTIAAGVCLEHSLVRNRMVSERWMTRAGDVYTFTDLGAVAWRVERLLAGLAVNE